jgi:hypothetical protein
MVSAYATASVVPMARCSLVLPAQMLCSATAAEGVLERGDRQRRAARMGVHPAPARRIGGDAGLCRSRSRRRSAKSTLPSPHSPLAQSETPPILHTVAPARCPPGWRATSTLPATTCRPPDRSRCVTAVRDRNPGTCHCADGRQADKTGGREERTARAPVRTELPLSKCLVRWSTGRWTQANLTANAGSSRHFHLPTSVGGEGPRCGCVSTPMPAAPTNDKVNRTSRSPPSES